MLITNANLITWERPNRILNDHALFIEDSRIVEYGPQLIMQSRHADTPKVDAQGQYVMPGNICAHTHFYSAFARGLAIPGAAPQNFVEILKELWWPLDRALDHLGVRYSALVCLVDAIRHGTTTLIDHHASPNVIPGSLDIIAKAVEDTGLRASLCYEVSDRGGKDQARAGIEENLRFIKRVRKDKPAQGRLQAHFGLHASLTLSDETLDVCRKAISDETGFHIHLAEDVADQYDSLAKSGLRVTDRLYQHGILGPKTIVAHGVHLDAGELIRLVETGTWLTHQPRSNMNNAVGVADVESMLRSGVKVCLGNDGFSNAMWEEWKAAYLVQKVWHHDPRRMSGMAVAEMGVYNNASLASAIFGSQLGALVEGAQADLIFVDYHPFTPLTPANLPWHILFGFHESMVSATIVAGKVLMYQHRLTEIDEIEIAAKALEVARKTWKRYSDLSLRQPEVSEP
jgi:putative selenium metabolism protein SsnA